MPNEKKPCKTKLTAIKRFKTRDYLLSILLREVTFIKRFRTSLIVWKKQKKISGVGIVIRYLYEYNNFTFKFGSMKLILIWQIFCFNTSILRKLILICYVMYKSRLDTFFYYFFPYCTLMLT